jgi:hypothetical protein
MCPGEQIICSGAIGMGNTSKGEFSGDLGCDRCLYNQGNSTQPVCGHPQGPRFIFSMRCVNCVLKEIVSMNNGEKEIST